MKNYVPLHTHSEYSILSSSIAIAALVKQASKFELDALALTDFGNLHGVVEFYKKAKAASIKPIIGLEMMVAPGSMREKKRVYGQPPGHGILLLAKDNTGYKNLCKLSSIGYTEGFYYYPRIDKQTLEQHAEGLICLSGPLTGILGHAVLSEDPSLVEQTMTFFKKTFGSDFYLEIQRHNMSDEVIHSHGFDQESWLHHYYLDHIAKQTKLNSELMKLSKTYDAKLVATNDAHYLLPDDWKAQEILMNIQSGETLEIVERDGYGNQTRRYLNPKRKVLPSHEHYFKSPAAMDQLFVDLPEAIKASGEIADRCNVKIDFNKRYYPVFVPPHLEGKELTEKERSSEVAAYLRKLCLEAIPTRYTDKHLAKVAEKYPGEDPLEVVHKRLEYELEIIVSKEMADYLLIVYDFIAWAKGKSIPVGPGRGSGAGAIVLYLIGITDIEPLRFNLFFERFINPERMSYPDIDVDICMHRRHEVIDYTINKYGSSQVAQIITFGKMKAKMAIKDVGRVLNVELAKVNAIAKMVPDDLGITIEKALEMNPELPQMLAEDKEAKLVVDFALKLEGCTRNTGIHAAGIIISAKPLTEVIPVCTSKESDMVVTQFAMKPVESVGMLKVDFLGLKTLTSISQAVKAVKESEGVDIDWVNLPLDDKNTYDLLNQGKTNGIFQLESSGMQQLARQLHIDHFEEIIAVGALYRPGPMSMIPSYIDRKHGREKVEIDHPLMEKVLEETYGIMVYQEQVMQIASLLAGYSLGEGDLLRRAMGKKDREEMARQRKKFRVGALEKGIPEEKSMFIFDKIEKFASYGFNKSHAAAYGYLSYVTAFLKANYPKQWQASLMSCDKDDVSKLAKHIREAESMGIDILPPSVNEAGVDFKAVPDGIRFALPGIKGVGLGAVEAIVKEREENGPFLSLYHFLKRTDATKVGKKVVENLVQAGSFDFTGWHRNSLLAAIEPIFERTSLMQKEASAGVMDFFEQAVDEEHDPFAEMKNQGPAPDKRMMLMKEKELLGFFLTDHPMNAYRVLMKKLGCQSFDVFEKLEDKSVIRAAFIVEGVRVRISAKTQKKFAILVISDGVEHMDLPVWANMYHEKAELCEDNKLLFAFFQVDKSEGMVRLRCRDLWDLETIDDSCMQEIDTRFDKLKQMVARETLRPIRDKKKEIKEKGESMLKLTLPIDNLKFTQILKLKETLENHGGTSLVTINFTQQQASISKLKIDPSKGVELSDELKAALKELSFIQSFSFERENSTM